MDRECKRDMSQTPLLVFTDLDGTLLDHDTYSWAPALPALSRLRAHGVPVVLASSKTAAEIALIRADLRLTACPAIVENGAGVLLPHTQPDATGDHYAKLRALLDDMPGDLRQAFRGFGDLTIQEVAEITGLPQDKAALAKARAFSEPGLFSGNRAELNAFVDALRPHGISARRGGRFLTLSFGGTKADRMGEILTAYDAQKSVALGDAPNDVEMLEAADIGVIIANPGTSPLPMLSGERDGHILRSEKNGPKGWNEMVLRILGDMAETAGQSDRTPSRRQSDDSEQTETDHHSANTSQTETTQKLGGPIASDRPDDPD